MNDSIVLTDTGFFVLRDVVELRYVANRIKVHSFQADDLQSPTVRGWIKSFRCGLAAADRAKARIDDVIGPLERGAKAASKAAAALLCRRFSNPVTPATDE